ncbi:MAG: SufD family Fe-S cluster assembly protein, partial [Alicyclobacillus sp.]|nr:SufD family Fe-S cluster assembly protein [Alicyclobacillus sp.]
VYEWTGLAGGCAPRSLVFAGPESRCTFAEVFFTAPGAAAQAAPAVLEVVAEHGAQVQVVNAQTCQRGPVYLSVRRARLAADASVDWMVSHTGDGLTVATVESELVGNGSRSTLQGVALGTGRQHLDLTASMRHQGRYSQSDIRLQGVLRGRANTIFRSSTHIAKGAVGAGSEQHSRMLMLERSARADAIPMLLIDENDVQRCGHAASVGRIDETQVYYLMSRGIPQALATKMIIWGYLEPALEVIPSEPVRHHIVSLIDRGLGL